MYHSPITMRHQVAGMAPQVNLMHRVSFETATRVNGLTRSLNSSATRECEPRGRPSYEQAHDLGGQNGRSLPEKAGARGRVSGHRADRPPQCCQPLLEETRCRLPAARMNPERR